LKADPDKIGVALQLQQINILEIEYLKVDLEENKEITPERLKEKLDRLLNHSVKTSKILQELAILNVNPGSVQLEPGTT
jgi:hypothetical protein